MVDSSQQEIFDMLGSIVEDMDASKREKLEKFIRAKKGFNKVTPQDAKQLIEETGIDILAVQKKVRAKKAEERKQNKKPKVGRNELCPCESGKKFKKCCGDSSI